MMAPLRRLQDYRTVEYGEGIRANFIACTDSEGRDFVDIELRRQAHQGPGYFLKTDLDGLNAIIKRGDEIMRTPEGVGSAFSDERINKFNITFLPSPTRGQPESLDLQIVKIENKNRQVFNLNLDRLKSIMRDGEDVERGLGYDQKRLHLVVYDKSLERGGDGRIEATVFKSVATPEEARRLIKDNEGKALYSEPSRKFLESGAKIEVRPEETLERIRGDRRTVEGQVVHNDMVSERSSEHFVVGKWGYNGRQPSKGELVKWGGDGVEYNGNFQDYTVKPVSGLDKAVPTEEMFVLVRIKGFENGEEFPPGHGRIVAFSPNKREMTAELARSETAEQEHRLVSTDWNKQSLGMTDKGPKF